MCGSKLTDAGIAFLTPKIFRKYKTAINNKQHDANIKSKDSVHQESKQSMNFQMSQYTHKLQEIIHAVQAS